MTDDRNNTTENVQYFSCKESKAEMHIAVCQNVIQNVKCQTDMRGEKQLTVKCSNPLYLHK